MQCKTAPESQTASSSSQGPISPLLKRTLAGAEESLRFSKNVKTQEHSETSIEDLYAIACEGIPEEETMPKKMPCNKSPQQEPLKVEPKEEMASMLAAAKANSRLTRAAVTAGVAKLAKLKEKAQARLAHDAATAKAVAHAPATAKAMALASATAKAMAHAPAKAKMAHAPAKAKVMLTHQQPCSGHDDIDSNTVNDDDCLHEVATRPWR